ncbi:MAG: thiamine diphosphokinase [Firmicutes bacterium]|nr:thiamine diphosphokinase [Bacillota bacterium]
MEKKILIITGGKAEKESIIKKAASEADYIICADGGAKSAFKLGVKPDIIIGDFDSLPSALLKEAVFKGVTIQKHSPCKDKSDLELAVDYALSLKPLEITIAGALGRRIDHTLFNIFLLKKALCKKVPAKILSSEWEIFLINKKAVIRGRKNFILSLIPLEGDCHGICLKGVKYILRNETLVPGNTRGLSNIILSEVAEVKLMSGMLIAMLGRNGAGGSK